MGGEQINKKQSTGKITSGIKSRTFQLAIINFIYQQLPIWRDDSDRPDEQSEDKLNLQLCKFIDSCAREYFPMVRFDHEEYQTGQRRVDISASPAKSTHFGAKLYTIYDPILVLEGKRLPAPSSDREKEYATGTNSKKISGGIQRFKLGLHGAKHNLAVIIGYLQNHSARFWQKKINGWMSELVSNPIGDGCIWTTDETLQAFKANTSNYIYRYHSIHNRTGKIVDDKIELHHLWVTM
ncbi:MAG: hypothetical protein FVQ80_01120 [Planctomycetes bacterium]|nr:hypothetical protein [Planctomycetota bacterium]